MELQIIQNRIYQIRGLNVMLDFDLAEMYGVETRRLKEQVKRNKERFPSDFMFQLTKEEWTELVAICDKLPESIKYSPITPLAFTQEGVAMLSGVLRSPTAIEVNISIMRAFVALRQYVIGYSELNQKLETFMIETNMQFNEVYQALTELASKKELEEKPRNPVGYVKPKKDQ
uniref:ORF6N domain-containing protein n=1 Tax=uncultured Dysgonomonas sp. TaxID=206096 RepID=UPI0026326F02|nr:ORF6N domain-containing protein [uncultured Dysgonomonas sp.]